jgi:hypothetical protein
VVLSIRGSAERSPTDRRRQSATTDDDDRRG